MWKFSIPRNQVSTTVDIKNPKVSTTVDIKTGLGVNRRTARCPPPGTGGVPRQGQGVSPARDINPRMNPLMNPRMNPPRTPNTSKTSKCG